MVNDKGHADVLTLADLDVLEGVIVKEKPGLVIIDPVIAFMAGKDTSKANEVRSLLSPLASLAERHSCAIVAVRHLNKSTSQALYRGQGSIDFIAACRSAFVIGENPDTGYSAGKANRSLLPSKFSPFPAPEMIAARRTKPLNG
jgi:hypothetical protein